MLTREQLALFQLRTWPTLQVSIENVETTTLIMAMNRTKEVCPKKGFSC